jgi:hypothetical protein
MLDLPSVRLKPDPSQQGMYSNMWEYALTVIILIAVVVFENNQSE